MQNYYQNKMNRLTNGQSETEVIEVEQNLDQNIQIAQFKNLRLRFDSTLSSQFDAEFMDTIDRTDLSRPGLSEQVGFLIDFFNQIDLSSQANSNYVLLINKIKTLNSYLDFSTTDRDNSNFDYLKNQLIEFLVNKLDYLFNRLKMAKSTELANNLVSLIAQILRLLRRYFNPEKLMLHYKKLILFSKQTRNNKILNEVLSIWTDPNFKMYKDNKDMLLPILKKNFSNSDYRIRSKCLSILTYHYTLIRSELDDSYAELRKKIIKILMNFLDDSDPRVRTKSLELMIMLHCNGINVAVECYDDIKQSIFDDYDQVRLLSTQMISLLAFTYPEYQISINSDQEEEKIRLADEVFSKICFMINDISLDVRICASFLLGKIDLVSSRFLLQTLDKKLMMDLKLRKIQKFRQKTLVANEFGGPSTSTSIIGESSDSQIDEDDNLKLITQGACGAFIHGLEDEFLEVRTESVESLCRLAINCPKLAAKAIDFLVDMFNDEIELVRLKAIQALNKILHYVLLGDDQVDIVVSVIEDSSFDIRESLKDLLSNCKLATKIGVRKTVQALLKNLGKYPNDKTSIWKCFKSLGQKHSKFVMSLISYLINLHPFIDLVEPDINDYYYISTLIMIMNAVNQNSAIIPLLPKYIFNHYFYIKLKHPNLIPSIRFIENESICGKKMLESAENKENSLENLQQDEMISFFLKTRSNLKNLSQNLGPCPSSLLGLFDSFSHDLEHLSEIDLTDEGIGNISVICEIMKSYLDCYMTILKVSTESCSSGINTVANGEKLHNQKLIQIEQALLTSINLILLYKGYQKKEKVIILKMYLYLRGLYLREFYLRKNMFSSFLNSYLKLNLSRKDFVKECHLYISLIKLFDALLDPNFKQMLFGILNELPIDVPQSLKLTKSTPPKEAHLEMLLLDENEKNTESKYVKMYLELIEPVDNLDSPIRFQPGLVSLIKIRAILYNFNRFDNLYIQITYSDNEKNYISIDSYSIKHLEKNKHTLETDVHLANLALTENCMIKMCITMLVDEYTDIKESANDPVTSAGNKEDSLVKVLNSMNAGGLNEKINKNNLYPIELSKNVKIYFEPLAKKYH